LDPLSARKDALGKKRLDQSLRQLVDVLGAAGARDDLSGRACIDFGAGYVPMDAVSMWLLGADSVVAVDYNHIANFRAMRLGVAKAELSDVRDLLRDVAPDCDWATRLQVLQEAAAGRHDMSFDKIPFRYIAPLDVIADPQGLPTFDFLWSTSVLEHIVPSKLIPLLAALNGRAAPGAVQVHRVDLRDHRDFDGAPYGFLDPKLPFDPEAVADVRGNAMTWQAWESMLGDHPELGLHVAAADEGRPSLVPRHPDTGLPLFSRVAEYLTVASAACRVGGR
jgi:hypothetical protein